jgi:hypothetical protein
VPVAETFVAEAITEKGDDWPLALDFKVTTGVMIDGSGD